MRRTSGPPKVGAAVPIARRPAKPECPTHYTEMRFDTNRMVWSCTMPNCRMIAYPKEEVEAGKGKPRIATGSIEAVKAGGRVYLRSPDTNILMDITDHATTLSAHSTGSYRLVMYVDGLVDLADVND